ncbi:hypothetical protein ASPWEDRAFT_114625 [Aspergillus wentii DTO 134E9]|uniref:Glycosyl hydrolase family 88 n=1 Tax=Aspergillus wentii DTO 134E9 TaxID=1073089 RepID=A0A1L9RFD2_ASPWE|nr:uncharacterized protein ASPWEDRAFT_114625 [Aspergillus wentii DTO 134E9]OJJ33583.1 hypothetical protein ASPWEDRAFT_114625 [Aspergillus wentii DTO 134E9]
MLPYLPLGLLGLFPQIIASTCDARPYSAWMADSVIGRGQATVAPGDKPSASTYLQIGFFQTAILRLKEYYDTPESACAQSDWEEYLRTSTDSIAPFLLNATHDTEYPLDRLSTGRGLTYQYKQAGNITANSAENALRESINLQPRNQFGGYWYFTYPEWSYLDGIYSLVPFLSYYTTNFDSTNSSAVAGDIIHQLDLLWSHCRHNSTGLLVHGYDASKNASWANPVTGGSPIVWGRSLGWYLMALVDTLESMTPGFPHELKEYLHRRLVELTASVVAAADPETGCWWQAMNYPGREGNYIESSGSAMFTYALYKSARLGYLPDRLSGKSSDTANQCRNHLVDSFVVDNKNGTLGYNGTVSVCSLNSSATYEYYITQPLLYNSVHGTAAFVLASLEHEISEHAKQ